MPIIGLSFNKMEGNRDKTQKVRSEVKVNSVPRIKEVREVSIPSIDSKKVLSLDFEFVTNYDPSVGEIKVAGDLLYMSKNQAAVLKEWKKNKKLPEDSSLEVLNYLFRRCLLRVSNIAEDLQLPPPIPMPRVKPKEKGK